MADEINYVELVGKAQLGDKRAFERLTKLAGGRLREDIGRNTLRVSITDNGSTAYPSGVGPGVFLLPGNDLR
jgi:hypothetical protein